MFRHILIPIDADAGSRHAIGQAVTWHKLSARVSPAFR